MKDNHRLQENGRFSAKRKTEAVLQLLRGEDLDLLSREYKVTAGKLSQWRDAFLAGGQAGLQSGTGDERDQQIIFLLDCGRRLHTSDGAQPHFDVFLSVRFSHHDTNFFNEVGSLQEPEFLNVNITVAA